MKPRSTTAFLLGIFFCSGLLLFPATTALSRPAERSTRLAPVAPASQGLLFAGHIGGTPGAITIQGVHVYAGFGRELAIISVANPAVPVQVGVIMLPSLIQKVVVAGNTAFIAAGDMYVVDIANPTAPAIVGSFDISGEATDLAIEGDYAYLMSQGVLSTINIADRSAPTATGVYTSEVRIDRVAITSHYAYLRWLNCDVSCSSGLEIVDIGNPAHPTLTTHDPLFGVFREIVFAGNYGYVVGESGGFNVLNVADPAHPVVVGSNPVYATHVSIVGDKAFIDNADYVHSGELRVVNIADPANPIVEGVYEQSGVIITFVASGRHVYFADAQDGLGVVDVLNPTAPARIGSLAGLIHPRQVTVHNSYAYVIEQPLVGDNWKQQPNGVKIVDVSDPSQASVVGVYRPAGTKVNTLAIAGNYAYIGTQTDVLTETGTLNIVNVADPAHPVEVAVYKIPGATWIAVGPIVVVDHYAYVGDQTKVQIVDVADPAHPHLVGSYTLPQASVNCLAIANGYMYLGLSNGDLQVVNVSDPAHPTTVTALPTQYYAIDIAVVGQYAYMVSGLASDAGALYAINISDPANPTQTSHMMLRTTGQIAAIQGSAYVTNPDIGTGGVQVIDTSDPFHLSESMYYATGTGADVAISGAFLYVAADDHGLYILQALTLTPRSFVPLIE